MGCIIEFFGELFIEIFGTVFISLGEELVPDKALSEKAKKVLKKVSAAVSVLIMLAHIIGIAILIEDGTGRILGWVLTAAMWVFLLFAFAVIANKYLKNKKSK